MIIKFENSVCSSIGKEQLFFKGDIVNLVNN